MNSVRIKISLLKAHLTLTFMKNIHQSKLKLISVGETPTDKENG
jgi:hypothetical protein